MPISFTTVYSLIFLLPGVPGFFSTGSVCDTLPAEGDHQSAPVPAVITGLRYGGSS